MKVPNILLACLLLAANPQAQDEWAKLVVIYDAQLDFIDDHDRRGHLLCEIARLHEERGGSLELAFRALCRAFEEEFGDLLFAMVQVSRRLRLDAETTLQAANAKFIGRFEAMEAMARQRELDLDALTAQQWDDLWNEVKKA